MPSDLHLRLQFESIANFSAVVDRLGQFLEVLESSAEATPLADDAQQSGSATAGHTGLIDLVDKPGRHLQLRTC